MWLAIIDFILLPNPKVKSDLFFKKCEEVQEVWVSVTQARLTDFTAWTHIKTETDTGKKIVNHVQYIFISIR